MQNKTKLCTNNDGVVLVLVLMVLVATIIIGVAVSRSSFFEAKIVGNERLAKSTFYAAEGAGDYIMTEFGEITSEMSLSLNTTYDLTSALPSASPSGNATVTLNLIRTGIPPTESGYSPVHVTVYYYYIKSKLNDQDIDIAVWKAFPKQ